MLTVGLPVTDFYFTLPQLLGGVIGAPMDELSQKRYEKSLRKKLDPDVVSDNLMTASLFLMTYELLKGEIIDKTREFFFEGINENEKKYSPQYASDVVSLHKDRFHASCLWLVRSGALSETDAEIAQNIRQHRNLVAHELPLLLFDPSAKIDSHLFAEAQRLLVVLGRFWGRIAIDINPDFDGKEVSDDEIQSGAMVLMGSILEILVKQKT